MKKISRLARIGRGALALALFLLGVGASGASANTLKLFYARVDNGNVTNIYSIAPTPIGPNNQPMFITQGTTPNISPDGTKMVFARPSDGIYIANSDGTGEMKLAPIAQATDGSPSFNDQGTQIVYISSGKVAVINPDKSGQMTLTSGGNDRTPRWNHAGDTIYFARSISGTFNLFSVSSSGGTVTQEGGSNTMSLSSIAVRQDDSALIYSRVAPTRGLYRYTINGTTAALGTSLPGDAYPAFSPDETLFAFSSTASGRAPVGSTGDLFLANIDSANNLSNITNLTNSATNEFAPVFGSVAGVPVSTLTITSFSPTSGAPVSTSVVITGTSFTGATSVKFNGTAATSYTVNSATQITATVPNGATTGPISVTTAGGTATSTNSFTVLASAPTSGIFISQFRSSGPNGSLDEFIELANTGNPALNLSGWKLTDGGALNIALSGTIPQGGHLLATNSGGYSLSNYGGTGQGVGDVSYTGDLGTSGTLSLLNPQNVSVDSVNIGTLFGAASPTNTTDQYAFVRRLDGGAPAKTGSDTNDFNLVDTASTNSTSGSSGVGPLTGARLGAPSPHNTLSPIARNARIGVAPLSIAGSGLTPEARYASKGSGIDPQGRLSLRRTITNNTGGTVTRMRFRITALTAGTSANSAVADLRAISSAGVRYYDSNHVIQQAAEGIALEAPSSPTEVPLTSTSAGNGGGLNSTWSVPLPSGGLAAGQSLNVEWLFGIVHNGQYRVVLDTELLP